MELVMSTSVPDLMHSELVISTSVPDAVHSELVKYNFPIWKSWKWPISGKMCHFQVLENPEYGTFSGKFFFCDLSYFRHREGNFSDQKWKKYVDPKMAHLSPHRCWGRKPENGTSMCHFREIPKMAHLPPPLRKAYRGLGLLRGCSQPRKLIFVAFLGHYFSTTRL